MPRTHYDVLGVPRDATPDRIRNSYVALARRYHPDVNRDPDANQRMAELNLAYETLSDHDKRSRYDAEIALRDPADELNHSQAVALAASAARLVAEYCPDPLVRAAIDAAELYALRPLPSSAFLASQAAGALTSRIFAEPALDGPAGGLTADSAAKAVRAAAASATAPREGAEAWAIDAWRGMNANWLGEKEGGKTVEAWGRRARWEAECAVIFAFQRLVGPRQPKTRELQERIQDQWSSWIDLLIGGMTATEFLNRRTVDPALQEAVESTLRADVKPTSKREMKGELIPISKLDRDKLEQLFAAQTRLVEDIKDGLKNPLRAISGGLNTTDRDALLAQCVERYKHSLPISVLVNTVFVTPFAVESGWAWWSPPFLNFETDLGLDSLRALLNKEEFKIDWGDNGRPSQIVIQTASGSAAFQICENESNFPEGERIEVHELRVSRSAAFLSRNTRYTFELLGWG